MNLLATLADNEVVTVRGIINKYQTLRLKQGLVGAGAAVDTHQLHRLRDEIIVWDEDGNVLLIPVINGCWTQPVTLRTPSNPSQGSIVASLKETKKVQYNPITTTHKTLGEAPTEVINNNLLHFYRSEHPDTMPFMSVSALWLAVPAFQNLLSMFSEGDYSELDNISHVNEPKGNITIIVPASTRKKYPDNVFPAYFEEQIA